MPEPLKNQYGPEIPEKIAGQIAEVFPAFDRRAFLRDALEGYETLELMPRGRHIARALEVHLPADYPAAIEILLASLGPRLPQVEGQGLAPFLYLPHTHFVAQNGLDHFEISMRALHALTQRFTGEWAIRPFLTHHTAATLARLHEWTTDPSPHVRRLVSEGTRPRLPWAARLPAFQRDPTPVLALLEKLKDDPELYVRRSVANNLNDIGKDHPELLAEVARRWLAGAPEGRRWLVGHALRSALKRGEAGALTALGFGEPAQTRVEKIRFVPERARIGGAVEISFEVVSTGEKEQRLLVDLAVRFVKANGKTSPKVFKLKSATLAPGETLQVRKRIALTEMSTRQHYPGHHAVEALVNGEGLPLGGFELEPR